MSTWSYILISVGENVDCNFIIVSCRKINAVILNISDFFSTSLVSSSHFPLFFFSSSFRHFFCWPFINCWWTLTITFSYCYFSSSLISRNNLIHIHCFNNYLYNEEPEIIIPNPRYFIKFRFSKLNSFWQLLSLFFCQILQIKPF